MIVILIIMIINVNHFLNLDAAGANMSCDTQDEECKSEEEVADYDKKKKK